jgi:hypothetical protein
MRHCLEDGEMRDKRLVWSRRRCAELTTVGAIELVSHVLSSEGLTMHLSSRMCSPIRSASVASFSDFERVIPGMRL